MLKIRIIPTLLYKNFNMVKGVSFNSWRTVGSLIQTARVYNMRQVDELIFLDIAATPNKDEPDFELISDLADECFMPLTVGGGIRSIGDVKGLLRAGADKVAINTQAVENPELIRQISRRFGSQCLVVSIDAKKVNGQYEVYIQSGSQAVNMTPADLACIAETNGAGEILITSIDRDGTMDGYDLDLIQMITEAVDIPVIASGGAGNYDHMHDALQKGKADAIAAASIYHFTESTPLEAKQYLKELGYPIRILEQ